MASADMTVGEIGPDNPGWLRSLLRSPAIRGLKYRILGKRFFRRLFTGNFTSGMIALGERNTYAFPMCWITVDWADADFSFWLSKDTVLPFADNSQSIVYSAHMMEHVEDDVLQRLFREICRVLKSGGGVRIEVPDADKLVAAWRNRDRAVLDYFRTAKACWPLSRFGRKISRRSSYGARRNFQLYRLQQRGRPYSGLCGPGDVRARTQSDGIFQPVGAKPENAGSEKDRRSCQRDDI